MLMSCRQFHLTPSRAWHLRGKTFKADSTASLFNIRFSIGTENTQKDIRAETCLLTRYRYSPRDARGREVVGIKNGPIESHGLYRIQWNQDLPPHTPRKLPASLVLQYKYTEMGEGDGL